VLRTNLSTRPFYNERAVHVAVALAALLVLALTVLNVVRIVSLSRHNTELSSRIGNEHAEATRLTQAAKAIRTTINRDELELVVAAAREANSLIDQRTFSWTAFFNHIEATLPPDVMLTSVRPSFDDGETWRSGGRTSRPAPDIAGRIVRAPSLMGIIVAATEDGAVWSVNRGIDWVREPESPRDVRAVTVTTDAKAFLIGNPQGISRYQTGVGSD